MAVIDLKLAEGECAIQLIRFPNTGSDFMGGHDYWTCTVWDRPDQEEATCMIFPDTLNGFMSLSHWVSSTVAELSAERSSGIAPIEDGNSIS